MAIPERTVLLVMALATFGVATLAGAQATGDRPAASSANSPGPAGPDFPRPPGDPAAIARGKQIFSVNCGFCHGSDARGGEVGPNLLRSPIVLNDQQGEIIAAVVLNGRVEKGMPKFNMTMENVADIAAYVHDIKVGRNASALFDPRSVLVGDPAAGKTYFNGKGRCTACHSVSGDLAGIGSKYNPKSLQDTILTGGGSGMLGIPSPTAPARTVSITLPAGELIKGRLISVDDFVVVLTDVDGNRRTIRRDGDIPRVEISNPLQAHLDMVRSWEDGDLHNVTAYLVTVK